VDAKTCPWFPFFDLTFVQLFESMVE
jgi:hypothetical protein